MKGALLLLASAPLVAAMCPNSCSGQGECGDYDACTCYANYRGADCSQRICPYAPAWVTTAKGDLNFDGDRVDYTVYNVDSKIADGFETFITQEFVGGDWESWPSHAEAGEGHFYMECANRGLCDRELGECACFPGYEGSACQRMVCPNDCSGKGTCQSTSYLTANPSDVLTDWYDTVPTANPDYAMWDGTMAMSCKCDPGYSGPDCSVRMCPVGDDPVTITNQIYETQFIDIFTPCEGTNGGTTTNCPTASATSTIGGSVTLTFTDHFGEEHTTAPIDGLVAYEGSNTAFAAAAQAALRALPNRVVSDTLTVHSMFCEYLEPSETAVANGVATVGGTTTTHAVRALSGTGCVAAMGNSVYATDGKVKVVGSDTGSAAVGTKEAAGASADCTVGDVSIVETPLCHRLVVNFDGMPGNFANLKVDVSEATHDGKTNAQDAGSYMQATVTSRLKIAGATVELGYTAPGTITVADDDSYLDVTTAGQTDIKLDITDTGNILGQAVTNTFPTSSRVKVECGGDAGTTYRNLGVYTVLSSTANILSIAEVIPTSTIHDDCGSSANGHYIRLTMVSHIVKTGADATTGDGAAADTSVDAGLILPSIQGTSAVRVGVGLTIGAASYVLNSHYSSSDHSATLSTAATAQTGSIIMYSESTVSNGKNAHQTGGNAAGAGTILGSNDATTAAAIAAGTLSTAAAGTLFVEGDGTHESVECGARGLCDTEAGECKCFAGYTGLSCGSQNALQL